MNWLKLQSHFILFSFLSFSNLGYSFSAWSDQDSTLFLDLSPFTSIHYDADKALTINNIESVNFIPLSSHNKKIKRGHSYWLRINLPKNQEPPFYLQLSNADRQEIFVPKNGSNYGTQKTGYMIGIRNRSLKHYRHVFKIEDEVTSAESIYVHLTPYLYGVRPLEPRLFSQTNFHAWENENYQNQHFYYLFNAFILGIFLIMMLYGIFSYWVTKDQTYLWYGLYLLFLGLYFALKFDNRLYYWDPSLQMSLFDPVPLVSYYFYYRFVRSFLNLKKLLPAWDTILKYMGWLVLAYTAWDLIFMQVAPNVEIRATAYTWLRYLIILLSIIIIVRFYFTNSKLVHFINTGSMFLLVGATITMIKDPLYYMQAGVALEILFFSLGLAYRNKLNEEAKREAQEKLIIEEQKEITLKSEFEKKLAKVEMNSLRAQMNPHFIFNSLNSIKHYIVKNNAAAASDYLAKFSRLMRLILQNSSANRVSLSSELEALKLYVQMEAMRFDGKFEFEMDVQKDVDLEFIQIPAMLIQPYVENAIWHGLMHKFEKGLLTLRVTQDGQRPNI